MTLSEAGLTVTAGMTTPTRPGKAPRAVWNVTGRLAPWESMLYDLGGRKWKGAFSFWSDPTDAIARAVEVTAPETYADREAGKQARAAERADRYTEWGQKADARSEAAYDGARAAVDGIPMGQPILVGHHSERRHRAALARHDARMDRFVAERKKAEHHRGKAFTAARTAAGDHSLGFMQRRIQDALVTIADCDRRLACQAQRPAPVAETSAAAVEEWVTRVRANRADAVDKLEYWRAQMDAAPGPRYSRETIKPGDRVQPRSHSWARVVRVNRLTVSVAWDDGPLRGMDGKYPYAELNGHEPVTASVTTSQEDK